MKALLQKSLVHLHCLSLSLWVLALTCLLAMPGLANPFVIYQDDFESYAGAVNTIEDTADANPDSADIAVIADNPHGGVSGSAVQLINWISRSGSQSLLLRPGADARIRLLNARSGSRYQFDFWLNVSKATDVRSFNITIRGMGSDSNGSDYIAYRSDRGATARIFYFDGIAPAPANAWVDTGVTHIENEWQHHRIVIDANARKADIYIDNMDEPVVAQGDLGRADISVPTQIWLRHEATSGTGPFNGYFAIDDISLTVEDSVDLSVPFVEDFESHPARTGDEDNANPLAPWITVESAGTAAGAAIVATKVQVVDASVVAPRSGSKSLKLEGGQRAGISIAWGQTAHPDVQITWWARVPASVPGTVATYLRMSLYGAENGDTYQGDAALLGYGSRDANIGGATSLTYFVTAWVDSEVQYTPDVWEEYRLITHTEVGTYTLLKNPSSSPETIVEHAPFIGNSTTWGPMFMAAWSSSNGTGHPPVYIDDIEIKVIETFPLGISSVALTPGGLLIQWNSTGAASYRVERATGDLGSANFQDISGELNGTEFTDTDVSAAQAYYRVVAIPSAF